MNPQSEQQIKYVHLISMSSSLIVINYVKSTSTLALLVTLPTTQTIIYPKDARLIDEEPKCHNMFSI